jgi:triacylglycerol lipase
VTRIVFVFLLSVCGTLRAGPECVVLLHGLARISNSMAELETKLDRSGFEVINVNYPSRHYPVEVLAADAVGRGVTQCRGRDSSEIHFVTHSLGGILVRYYLQHQKLAELGSVVMLGPPNHGSEMVDKLKPVPGFKLFSGPTGILLGTGKNSILHELGPVDFKLGVIAGDTSINPLSLFFSMGPNDSVVSVESTRVEGMDDHRVLPVTHTLMMRNNDVIDHVIHYLKTGSFIPGQ